jgi:hypothetical protein
MTFSRHGVILMEGCGMTPGCDEIETLTTIVRVKQMHVFALHQKIFLSFS